MSGHALDCRIRPAAPADRAAIREINRQAFRTAQPGTFERLLETCADALALVAEADGRVLGHVIFTPALVGSGGRVVSGMGLGELAVLTEFQRRGVGTRLGEAGLAALRAAGCPFCIVVGHASYYPRFGFEPGSRRGLACQWPKVPDASFMVAVLDEAAMRGVTGIARFRDVD
jgi:putative acetyltransferase